MSERIESFEKFWPFYLSQHSRPANRTMHFIGTTVAVILAVNAVASQTPGLMLGAVISGYAFAWIGHFFIEKNRPATFTYPLWSFIGDWKMWALMLTRRLGPELKRLNLTE